MSSAAQGTPILIYVLAGLIFSSGLFVLIFGLFGKRTDDHPWCRMCRFDLFGRDEDAEQTCPECGSDLSKAKAIRIGQRQKRKGVIAIGSLIMFLAVTGISVGVFTDVAGVNWQHYKPVSWLMSEANQAPGINPTSSDALFELRRRYDAGLLTPTEIDDILEAALTHQADPARPWQAEWGNFVELGRQNGDTTDAQWARYGEGVLADAILMEARPRIIIGTQSLPIRFSKGSARTGNENRFTFSVQSQQRKITTDSFSIPLYGSFSSSLNGRGWSSMTSFVPIGDNWNTIGPGKHKIVVQADTTLYEGANRNTLIAQDQVRFEQTVQFLPAGQSTVTLITDPTYRKQVKDAISITNLRSAKWRSQQGEDTYRYDVNLQVAERLFEVPGSEESYQTGNFTETSMKLQPIDVSFDVYVRYEGQEYEIGSITQPADAGMHFYFGDEHPINLTGKSVDVVFRPSVERAETSIDCFEIWGKVTIYKDVTVQ